MSIEFNEITAFFSSGLGILVQIVLFIGGLIPLLKYLDQRFDSQIDERVKKKIDPHITNLCKELSQIATKLHDVEVETGTAIRYINKAITHLQSMNEDRELRDYRLKTRDYPDEDETRETKRF
jgi:hypothetical protein